MPEREAETLTVPQPSIPNRACALLTSSLSGTAMQASSCGNLSCIHSVGVTPSKSLSISKSSSVNRNPRPIHSSSAARNASRDSSERRLTMSTSSSAFLVYSTLRQIRERPPVPSPSPTPSPQPLSFHPQPLALIIVQTCRWYSRNDGGLSSLSLLHLRGQE